MNDLISRQALLNKFEPWLKVKDYSDGELNMLKAILYEIRFMPSATDKNVGTKLSTNLAQVGTDCISRQAAIDALRVAYWDDNIQSAKDDPCIVDAMTDWAIRQVKALPPAQPKSGQWILNRSGAYCCSECMEPCASYVMMKPRDKFCKMCGSRNEVTE